MKAGPIHHIATVPTAQPRLQSVRPPPATPPASHQQHNVQRQQVQDRRHRALAAALPPGTTLNTPWPELYYRNLVRFFVDEILEDRPQECTFYDGAKSQEIVDAIIKAHYERRWVDLAEASA